VQRNSSTCGGSTLLFDVWLVTHLTGRLLDDALRPLGLTGDEFGLYSLIHARAPLTPTQISRWTGMAPTTVSGMLRRLRDRDHLSETPNPGDARSRMIGLSAAGQRLTGEAAGVLVPLLHRIEEVLDTDVAAVRAGLRDLDAALRRTVDAGGHPYGDLGGDPGGSPDDTGGDRPDRPAAVTYRGERLTPAQADEVRMFIDWLRTRDSTAGNHRTAGTAARARPASAG
jgi:DNA-binding MarR family transcriptional regulator